MLFSQKSNFTSTDDYSFRNTSVEKPNDYYKNENVKLHKIIIQMKLQMYSETLSILLRKSKIEEALSIQKKELKQILD